jgi:hypothetical protein
VFTGLKKSVCLHGVFTFVNPRASLRRSCCMARLLFT